MFNLDQSLAHSSHWPQVLTAQLFGARRNVWLLGAALVVLEVSVAVLVYSTGGTAQVYLQLMYLPLVLSGLLFGTAGGVLAGVLGGLLVGPWMPLQVAANLAQPTLSWVIRLLIFTMNGVVAGALSGVLRERLNTVETFTKRLSSAYQSSLVTLAALVDERDTKTADHSERVAYNAKAVGGALGLNQQELFELYWASLLHDLGKIGIGERVLNKPGPLEPAERLEMQRHVEIGCRLLLSASDTFVPISMIMRAHHERWDGTGYPDALAGEKIPLGGRVLAVLDVFEALTSDRPYRPALPVRDALDIVRDGSGSHFDPRIVNLFCALFERGEITLADVPKASVPVSSQTGTRGA
jgi:HD domain